jgi:AbrB family looped-hinge helix DNA binding protein
MTLTISNKGWVVIPAELRKNHNLLPGRGVEIVENGGVLALVPALKDPIRESAGMLKVEGRSLTRSLLEEHRRETESE